MTTRAGGSIALRPKVSQYEHRIRVARIGRVGPVDIWHVEGRVIRDHVYIDFTEGGNSRAYIWMPSNEIWLDHDVDLGEQDFVKLHELHEWNKMGDGLNYEAAHESANGVEGQARRDPSKLSGLWRAEVKRIKPERKGEVS